MAHKVGDKVVFVGREVEIDKYHPDYTQLMYQVGTVVEGDVACGYEVLFEGFRAVDGTGDSVFTCWDNELQSAP